MRESKQKKSERAQSVYSVLDELYPNVSTFLTHNNTFELLIAVILSAQCTDERVNMVTPGLFQRFPNPKALMDGPLEDIKMQLNPSIFSIISPLIFSEQQKLSIISTMMLFQIN